MISAAVPLVGCIGPASLYLVPDRTSVGPRFHGSTRPQCPKSQARKAIPVSQSRRRSSRAVAPKAQYIAPALDLDEFHYPHCGVCSHQQWVDGQLPVRSCLPTSERRLASAVIPGDGRELWAHQDTDDYPDGLRHELAAALKRRGTTLIEVAVGEMPDPWKVILPPRASGAAVGRAAPGELLPRVPCGHKVSRTSASDDLAAHRDDLAVGLQ